MDIVKINRLYLRFLSGPTKFINDYQNYLDKLDTKESKLKIWYDYACTKLNETELVILGFLPILKEMYKKDPSKLMYKFDHLLGCAVSHNHIGMYIWLSSEEKKIPKNVKRVNYYFRIIEAIHIGNLEMTKLILPDMDMNIKKNILDCYYNAIKFRHLHIIKYLYEKEPITFSQNLIELSIKSGDLDIVKWVIQRSNDIYILGLYFIAIFNENYNVLEWLFKTLYINSPIYTSNILLKSCHSHTYPKQIKNYLSEITNNTRDIDRLYFL